MNLHHPTRIRSSNNTKKRKEKKRTMHSHPRVLLLLAAAATLSTACSPRICAPGCNTTFTERREHESYIHVCEGLGPFYVPVDTCTPRVTNITAGDICGNPSLGDGYSATLECLSTRGACWYEVDLLYTDSHCTCPTNTSCSIEEKCASQQAEQVTQCAPGSYCFDVTVCGETGYCAAVAVKGNGTCATKPCSNSHDCTQDTPSNYTCAPKPMACCAAMPTCGAGLNTSNTPCTADEVSSGTCNRSALCCSEVFCRSSCSIEEECLAMNATQVASCTSVSSCSTVEVCGVEGYCMAASVDTPIPLTPSPCSIEAKCASQQAKQVTECGGSSCSKVEVCDVTGYCQAVLVKGSGSCAENPCSATHDCTQDTPSSYTCAPKPMACCDAMPTCGAGLNTSNTPCTADEVSSGTCSRSAMCCSEVFCRTASCSIEAKCAAQEAKQVTECPADASCLTVSVCGAKGYCMYATVPTPSTCSIAAKCAAAHAEEVSECPQDASCLEVEACGVKGYCMDVTYEGEGTCATKPCSGSRICSQESSSTYSCAPEPFACCEAAAVCDSGYKASMQAPCTADEVSSGTCSRSAICCSEVFCRKGGSSGCDDDHMPAYAWVLIALVSALLVAVVVSAVCLYRRMSAQDYRRKAFEEHSEQMIVA